MISQMRVDSPFILKINWFAKISFSNLLLESKDEVYIDQSGNVYIDQSGNTKLVLKVLKYKDIYRPEHLSSK
jgi:hypothetical protein